MTGLKSFGHTFQVSSTFMSYWFNFVLGKEGEREGDSDSDSDGKARAMSLFNNDNISGTTVFSEDLHERRWQFQLTTR